jgi:hypothetical protein
MHRDRERDARFGLVRCNFSFWGQKQWGKQTTKFLTALAKSRVGK